MLILTAADVRAALPMDQAIQAMKEAFAALSDGRAEVPLRSRLAVPPHEGLTLLMPAFVKASEGEALGMKVVSLFPGNAEKGIPYIQAAVLVLEPDSGRPLALLEGSSLTAIRTGAATNPPKPITTSAVPVRSGFRIMGRQRGSCCPSPST